MCIRDSYYNPPYLFFDRVISNSGWVDSSAGTANILDDVKEYQLTQTPIGIRADADASIEFGIENLQSWVALMHPFFSMIEWSDGVSGVTHVYVKLVNKSVVTVAGVPSTETPMVY